MSLPASRLYETVLCPSVCPSTTANPLLRVCCCAPGGQDISIDCCGVECGVRMRAVPRCQRTYGVVISSVVVSPTICLHPPSAVCLVSTIRPLLENLHVNFHNISFRTDFSQPNMTSSTCNARGSVHADVLTSSLYKLFAQPTYCRKRLPLYATLPTVLLLLAVFSKHFYTFYIAMGLCLSVCPSVTSRSSTKTAEHKITQRTPHDSSGTLIF